MPKTILVVEDFEDSRYLLKFQLEQLGYEVLQAEDGQEAIQMVKYNAPDLILMDIALPIVDGLTATRFIRDHLDQKSEIPIIAFTASGHSIYQDAMTAGCNEVVGKPLEIDALQPIIEQYLQSPLSSSNSQ
jgi:CheY-like chemotaxis protein